MGKLACARGALAVVFVLNTQWACDPTKQAVVPDAELPVNTCAEISGEAPRIFPAGTAPTVASEVDDKQRIVAPGLTCDRSDFFIEFDNTARTPCSDFPERVKTLLQAFADEDLCNVLGDTDEEQDPPFGVGQAPAGVAPPGLNPGRVCESYCDPADPERGLLWRPRGAGGAGAGVTVAVESQFSRGDRPEGRDGFTLPLERRFLKVRFEGNVGGQGIPLKIPHATLCQVLERIRRAADEALVDCVDEVDDTSACEPAPPVPVRIGRDCDVLGTGYAALPEMLDWHLRRLNLPPGAPDPGGEARPNGPFIALLDSGVQPGLGITDLQVDGTAAATAPTHPHGSLLAAMMLQVDPGARIVSYRALGGANAPPGLGKTADFARALEQVLFANPDTVGLPTIVNLSVGWPPELSRPRVVRGIRREVDPTTGVWRHADDALCVTTEDGPGGALRYALAMAYHAHEAAGRPPVTVFGAAGNRGVGQRPNPALMAETLGHLTCSDGSVEPRVHDAWCDGDRPKTEANLYLPALWGHEGVTFNPWRPSDCGEGIGARVIEPVGAIDDQDRVAITDPEFAQPPLVAPGERVYGAHPGLTATPKPAPLIAIGSDCDSAVLQRKTQPMALSGTSVSAALTTAVASVAQFALLRADLEPLSGRALSRFLYVTGHDTLRVGGLGAEPAPAASLNRIPVRRPDVCRARVLPTLGCARGVLDCVRAEPSNGPELGEAGQLADCDALAAGCMQCDADNANCQTLDQLCPAPRVEGLPDVVGFPEPLAPGVVAPAGCETSDLATAVDDAYTITGAVSPSTAAVRPESLLPLEGSAIVGPQPPIPVCPDCLIEFTASTRRIRFPASVNTAFPAGAKITSAKLVFYDTRLRSTDLGNWSQTLDLSSTTLAFSPSIKVTDWKAKTQVSVTGAAPVDTVTNSNLLTALTSDWSAFVKADLVCNVTGGGTIIAPIDTSHLKVQVLP